ncbi:MAG: efflux RND transporter periplasmic adaptor subunit, partial [Alphaproteobacteria bacterium]|nr:efflux RND transporter periplasmic adaptor subunit [Alphaproteobacteria bacterium]
MRRKFIAAAAAAIVAGAIAGGAAWVGRPDRAAVPGQASPPVPVVAGTVKQGDVPIYLRGLGTVQAFNTVTVRSQIQGQITSIDFTEGQTVHQGDLLAQIDPRTYQAQLDQALATKQRDQANLANTEVNLTRYEKLGQYATQQLVDNTRAEVDQLNAAIKSDQASIDNAQTLLSYTRLTSPIDGVTGIRQIDVGNVIHPTDANGLVVVTQIEPISVVFTLPETDLSRIQDAMAKGPLTVLAYSQDDKTLLDQGQLLLINNQIDQTTGTVQLKATFPNKAHKLWPGEFVNARLLLETRHDGLTVAASVVQRGPQGTYAYVITPDDTAEMRSVTVGPISEGEALIDSGLEANQQVVVDGQY